TSASVINAGMRSLSIDSMRFRTPATASTASSGRKMQRSNAGLFWPVLVLVTAVDFTTKAIAAARLGLEGLPHSVSGDWMRLTLVHNQGAAFGLSVGIYSRWIFMMLTIVALFILGRLYHATRPGDVVRTWSLALVCGGAVGNLIDRIRSANGVVDFIDIG